MLKFLKSCYSIILLTLLISGLVLADYTYNQPQTNITAPQAMAYIRNALNHYYNMFSQFACYSYSGYYLAGFDTSDSSNVYILKPWRVISASEAITIYNANGVDHPSNSVEGQCFWVDNGANDTLYYYDDDAGSYIAKMTSGGGASSISGTRVYYTWPGATQGYSYISNDYLNLVTTTSVNLVQWSNQISASVNYLAGDGLTQTYRARGDGYNAVTKTQYLTIDNHEVLRTKKRRDIPIGALALDDNNPPEVSQTKYGGLGNRQGYNTLLFKDNGNDRALFDFTVPADVTATSGRTGDIYVDVIFSVTGTANYNGSSLSGGLVNFALHYTPYQPISFQSDYANNLYNYVTNTIRAVTVSRFVPLALTNTAMIMPLTIASEYVGSLSEVYCTLNRCSSDSCTGDTYRGSVRLMNVRVHGINKNPD